MFFGSTSKNVNLLNISLCIFVLMGFFLPINFSIEYLILSIINFYILNILGVWMTMHRYYAHKTFEFKNFYLKLLFSFLALLSGRGSILSWVYIHRQHHSCADSENDPHSPKNLGYKIFGFDHYKSMETEKMKLFLVKDLMTKWQLFIHKYYMLFILFLIGILSINLNLLYFGYVIPVFLIHLSQNNFNYFGHTFGYRNFETLDNSQNNKWLFPFILGEAWHNNHHHDPKNITTKFKINEIDPLSSLITLVKK